MSRSAAVAVAFLLLATGAAAQDAAGGFALGVDVVRHGQSDAAASPLHYTGTLSGVRFHRTWAGSGTRWTVGADFVAGTLGSRLTVDGLPSEDVWIGRFDVRHLRRVGSVLHGRLTLQAGGELAARGPVRIHRYPVQLTEVFAALFVPLRAVGAWEWASGPTRVRQRLAVPLLGLVARTPYGGLKYVPRVQLSPPWELPADQELSVEHALTERLALRAGWSFSFLRHTDPRELRMAAHRLTVAGVLLPGGGR